MSKVAILLSFALFFSVVVAQEDETKELIEICKSINDPKQPPEVKRTGKECNDILQKILAKKGAKEDSVKIRFLGGMDSLDAYSVHTTAAMNSFMNNLTERQHSVMLSINELIRESAIKFKEAVHEFNAAIDKPRDNDKFKGVDAFITRAALCIFEIQTHVDQDFAHESQTPKFKQALESGVQFMTVVSRIKKAISEF